MTIAFADVSTETLAQREGVLVVLIPDGGKLCDQGAAIDAAMGGAAERAISSGNFKAKSGETLNVPVGSGLKADRVIFIGSPASDCADSEIRSLGAKIGSALGHLGETGATVVSSALDASTQAELAGGIALRRYEFRTYKSGDDVKKTLGPGTITLASADPAASEAAFVDHGALQEGVFFTRDLVSEPANVLYPESFADRLAALAELGVEIEILDDDRMEELGMGALLAVGKGSERGSRIVVMKWLGADDKTSAPFCAVGKGVTFDTGGISLKPAGGMEEMTMDMGGAGVVSGLMKTLALRKAKANVIGLVGLTENMPDGKATRPGDIVTAMSGTTIEVINTDAEGRLVLADVLYYAQKVFKPAATVNLATLTGAMVVALGNHYAGFFANDDGLADDLLGAAKTEGEALWRMPLGKPYDEMIKASLADIKNTGGRNAGAITAAQFLQRFVNDTPWAHIDIAGVTLNRDGKGLSPKGASGWGVATLNRYVRDKFES